MPVYTYRCKNCTHVHESVQPIGDEPERRCPNCQRDDLARVPQPVTIVFRGSGFHVNDYPTK